MDKSQHAAFFAPHQVNFIFIHTCKKVNATSEHVIPSIRPLHITLLKTKQKPLKQTTGLSQVNAADRNYHARESYAGTS